MAAGDTEEATLRAAVARIRLVPEAHRRYAHGEADVGRRHGIGAPLLERLLAAGLPHEGPAGDRRFDPVDLENAGLALRVGPRWRAVRWWSDSLTKADPAGRRTMRQYRVNLSARCPEPGHDGACAFELAPQLRSAIGGSAVREVAPGTYRFDVRVGGGRRRFGGRFAPLVEAATALHFHALPATLSADLGFLRETGLADSRLAAAHLTALGATLGLGVRPVEGVFMAAPYSVWHRWVDFRTGAGWYPADPFLLGALHRWGILDGTQWPADRSPDGLLWPLTEAKVTHGGRPAPARLGVEPVR